ncbi:MAG: transcription antitermination factor NusB [Alphaproteobacteria bacterium]|nr:transcription antitermination factor NusB [Alphaproteobacteria bacterium]
MNNKKHSVSKRSLARLAAVQAVYDIEISEQSVENVLKDFSEGLIGREVLDEDLEAESEEFVALGAYDKALMESIVRGVKDKSAALDETIVGMLDDEWKEERLEKTLHSILLCGYYELFYRNDIPAKVIVSEYVNIAYSFYSGAEPKMVNAMLDNVARNERADEF